MPVIPTLDPSPLATPTDLALRMRTTFDTAAEESAAIVLRDVSAVMRDITGMALEDVTDDTITIDGHGGPVELLPDWPVQAVHSVSVTRYAGDGTPTVVALTEHVDFEWSSSGVLTATSWSAAGANSCGGLIWSSRPVSTVPLWPNRPRSITVNYDHGPDAEMVGILQAICLEAAARVMSNPDGTLREQIGNYSVENSSSSASGVLTDAQMLTLKSLRGVKVR